MSNNIYCSRECRDKVRFTQDRFKKRLRRKARLQMAGNIATLLFATVGALLMLWVIVSFLQVIALNLGTGADYPSWNLFNIITGGEK